jgi:hypothetical protein
VKRLEASAYPQFQKEDKANGKERKKEEKQMQLI